MNGASQAAERNRREFTYRENGWWRSEPLHDRYARLSHARPDALALVDTRGRRLTHRQFWQASDEYASVLSRLGVHRSHIVLLQLPNCVEWPALFLAALRMGVVPATIPLRTDSANVRYVAQTIGARLIVVLAGAAGTDARNAGLHAVEHAEHAASVVEVAGDGTLYEIARGRGKGTPARLPAGVNHLMFTSSTTGYPKAVMHTTDTLAALNLGFSERFGLTADTPIFMPSPLGHSVGAIHGVRLALYNASALVLQEKWDPVEAIRLVRKHRCWFTAAATPFLYDLLGARRPEQAAKLDPLGWFLCGGAPVPPALMDRTRDEFPNTRVTVLWGMTEGGLTTCAAYSPWEKFRSTCGTGLPGLELRILDRAGSLLPAGNEGELAMRGPGVFVGYAGQDDLYRESLTQDEFFRTGDLGTLDEDGYLRITGRLKELIIRGGVNISPVPIEDTIAAHPGVASVAVVGAPDPRLGEQICAVIEAKGPRLGLEELSEFLLRRGLPKYHCPEQLFYVDAMPRTASGKIRKVDLRGMVGLSAASETS